MDTKTNNKKVTKKKKKTHGFRTVHSVPTQTLLKPHVSPVLASGRVREERRGNRSARVGRMPRGGDAATRKLH